MAAKAGRPRTIFNSETGRQLEIPLTATIRDLAELVGEAGRYRLEAVDRDGRLIPGCIAVTEIIFEEGDEDEDDAPATGMNDREVIAQLVGLVGRLVESNQEVIKAMATAFGQVKPNLKPPEQIVVPPEPRNSQPTVDLNQALGVAKNMWDMFQPQPANGTGQ
jgi:hypothetical protein